MWARQPHPQGFSLRFQGKSPSAETKSTTFATASVIRERKQEKKGKGKEGKGTQSNPS